MVDTNVLVAALLGTRHAHEAALTSLQTASELHAPESLKVELLSVLWQSIRFADLEPEAAFAALQDVEALVTVFHPVDDLLEPALLLALDRDHSPYDTLFVALAERLDGASGVAETGPVRVLTLDQALQRRFPDWCEAPGEVAS